MSWLDMRVRGLREEAVGILGIELRPAEDVPLTWHWEPGAHVDIRLEGGLVRQYSLTNLADEGCMRLAVKQEETSRGGSRWLHERLRIGSRLEVGAPRNLFPLRDGQGEVLLVAAGIGVTPLLAMYRQCRRDTRPARLLYFTRSPAHAAFADELAGDASVRLVHGLDGAGVMERLRAELPAWRPGATLYTCGPAPFMATVLEQAEAAGWPAEALFQEHFQAPSGDVVTPSAGLELVLVRSGRSVQVGEGETLVDAAARAGVAIPTSCGMGMCGCCLTRVLAGTPEHRDQFLSDAERDSGEWLLPCVSGCRGGRLELDC
ncbi:oxidoreductase [Pseudomonas sp. BN415]|uniref:PDR/VanB family oxidoreductase n=1 Tax=Pseudomonas sp. BN415 TaxID=2567889 RepID=UPI0024558A06|nr:PDR/VanB family oxidoreductase [Pseudomonas sp. BN415]MDH4585394.1 oxidoreductase [Pseudomonas sp. BN415]